MITPKNSAAWSPQPRAELEVREAPMYMVQGDEVLIKNEAICIQPLDARIRRDAYKEVPYPFILGKTVAGIVVAVGDTAHFKVGDRVVSDTPAYKKLLTKYGAWQRYVVGKSEFTCTIGDVPFDEAIALPFPLQTAVGALHMCLGMGVPGERPADAPGRKVLVWGAGGAVGGYAVQYARSAGYTVVATASPRAATHLRSIGASAVLDYKSPAIVSELRNRGPYAFLFTASGDPASQKAIALIMQPEGGKFASTLAGDVELPSNVERVYDSFADISQKEGPEFEKFRRWWYGEYLGKAIGQRTVQPALVERRPGGLNAIMGAADDVLSGRIKAKLVINPQE